MTNCRVCRVPWPFNFLHVMRATETRISKQSSLSPAHLANERKNHEPITMTQLSKPMIAGNVFVSIFEIRKRCFEKFDCCFDGFLLFGHGRDIIQATVGVTHLLLCLTCCVNKFCTFKKSHSLTGEKILWQYRYTPEPQGQVWLMREKHLLLCLWLDR